MCEALEKEFNTGKYKSDRVADLKQNLSEHPDQFYYKLLETFLGLGTTRRWKKNMTLNGSSVEIYILLSQNK